MKYSICAKRVFLENQILENTWVSVENGLISAYEKKYDHNVVDLSEYDLLPGFIDIHVHGGNGKCVMDGKYESLNELSIFKMKEGVTSFCPTTVTSSLPNIEKALIAISEAYEKGVSGADIIGPFIEGPYISREYKGCHAEDKIRPISLPEIKKLLTLSKGKISILIAPELDGAEKAIKWLYKNGINVRIGHSAANFETASNSVSMGANIAAHTYNAMSPFKAREPGLVGLALLNDDIYTELICDLHHSHQASIEILYKIKHKNKIILVTDCISAGGLADGKYILGDTEVTVDKGIARINKGNLAGSTVSMITSIKNIIEKAGATLFEAVNMASINPAAALGIDTLYGSIALNKKADLIAVDGDLNIKFVMIGGCIKLDNR